MEYNSGKNKGQSGNCLECGKALYGRTDKKFCGDKCKNSFHNARSHYFIMQKRLVCERLANNYDILAGLLCQGRTSVTIEELIGLGYKDGLVTEQIQCSPHTTYACFDILFSRSKTRIFQIRKKTP